MQAKRVARPSWREQARCRGKPVEWFVSAGSGRPAKDTPGLDLCVACPVTSRCLDAAMVKPEWSLGLWAGTTATERSEMARSMRKVIARGTDVRSEAFFIQFADDPGIVRDVAVAVEAPARPAAVLAARAELPVVAAVALAARHSPEISATLARRDDLPEWLRRRALAGMPARRCADAGLADEDDERWLVCEEPAGLLLDEADEAG
jgi:hypothetical protein